MARQVIATLREPAALPAGTEVAALGAGAAVDPLEGASFSLPATTKEQAQAQGIFAQVAEHIRREPVQSTRLIEAWIGSSEEGN
jgi:flagellar M-ring protein FliF